MAVAEAENVTYGLAEFLAAEEMYRTRGFWWSPDGRQLLVARVDTTPVARWHVSNPTHPDRPPVEVAYPRAGTANAEVSAAPAKLSSAIRRARLGRRFTIQYCAARIAAVVLSLMPVAFSQAS